MWAHGDEGIPLKPAAGGDSLRQRGRPGHGTQGGRGTQVRLSSFFMGQNEPVTLTPPLNLL